MKSFIIASSGNSSKSNEKSNPNTSVLSIQSSPKRSILPNLDESNEHLCIQEKESNKSKLTFDEPTKVIN